MKYVPKSDEDLQNEFLLPDGTYSAVVLEAVQKPSKRGNDMFELVLEVHPEDGQPRGRVWDYISPHFMHYKFKHFFRSAGLMELYQTGDVDPEQLAGACVWAVIQTQKQEGYPPKNTILDYIVDSDRTHPEVAGDDESDLPF